MDTKDTWISEVENSLKGLQPAEGSPFLFTRIQARLESRKNTSTPAKLVWLTAASLLILALLNLTILTTLGSRPKSDKSSLQNMSEQLQLMNTNTINYN